MWGIEDAPLRACVADLASAARRLADVVSRSKADMEMGGELLRLAHEILQLEQLTRR